MSNVALVVLDTLRKDFFDEFFDWLPGVRFENAWSTAHYTVPSHTSLFTGKYPRELGVHAKSEQFDCPDVPLSEKSRRSGYKTQGMYEDTVRYLSDRDQDLFAMMKRDYDYIITVSDHGELFGEHGLCKHPYGVYPELTHIPLSIYHENGCVSDQPVEETVSLLDVHRTIQAITGVTGESRGQNLLDAVTGGTYLVESQGPRGSIVENLKEAGIDQETLSNANRPLRGIVTPKNYYGYQIPDGTYVEQGNSINSDARSRLQELLDSIEMKEDSSGREEQITEDVEVHLRDLGYK